jgi:hypothetical protein
MPWWMMPVVAVVVLVLAGMVLAGMWWWVNDLPLDGEKKATAHLDVVKIASGVALGGGGLFTLYLAARRQRTQEFELAQREDAHAHVVTVAEDNRVRAERVAAATEADAADRRVTELYGKSVEQLGSDKAPVRLGGLYALERLAQGNEDQRETVINVLCAYLRMPFDPPDDNVRAESDRDSEQRMELRARMEEREVRRTAQRILADHLRPTDDDTGEPAPTFWSWASLDLTGAVLIDLDLAGCRLSGARFHKATFAGRTSFEGATILGAAEFEFARFAGPTYFQNTTFATTASFYGARFTSLGRFNGAKFKGMATFSTASFQHYPDLLRAGFTENLVDLGGVRVIIDLGSESEYRSVESSYPAGWVVESEETSEDGRTCTEILGRGGGPRRPTAKPRPAVG